MRGVHSAVDDIRRSVFTGVARLAYESDDYKQVDMIPYKIVPGEVAHHRHDVFLERAIVSARLKLALGMDLDPNGPLPPSAPISRMPPRIRNISTSPWSISFPMPATPALPSRSASPTAARAAFPTPA